MNLKTTLMAGLTAVGITTAALLGGTSAADANGLALQGKLVPDIAIVDVNMIKVNGQSSVEYTVKNLSTAMVSTTKTEISFMDVTITTINELPLAPGTSRTMVVPVPGNPASGLGWVKADSGNAIVEYNESNNLLGFRGLFK